MGKKVMLCQNKEEREPNPYLFRATISIITVFAAFHFTRMSSEPHLSALSPNFFNLKCLFYANRELVRIFGDVMVSITTWTYLLCIFSSYINIYYILAAWSNSCSNSYQTAFLFKIWYAAVRSAWVLPNHTFILKTTFFHGNLNIMLLLHWLKTF